MMIGMMMKVILTSTICTNMKNIHILKSYIDAILVPVISSMHDYPQKHSLQYQADSYTHDTAPQCLNSNNIKSDHGTEGTIKTFPTMLKLICGTLVGGVKYSDILSTPMKIKRKILHKCLCEQ
jgi:hypothetical protein